MNAHELLQLGLKMSSELSTHTPIERVRIAVTQEEWDAFNTYLKEREMHLSTYSRGEMPTRLFIRGIALVVDR